MGDKEEIPHLLPCHLTLNYLSVAQLHRARTNYVKGGSYVSGNVSAITNSLILFALASDGIHHSFWNCGRWHGISGSTAMEFMSREIDLSHAELISLERWDPQVLFFDPTYLIIRIDIYLPFPRNTWSPKMSINLQRFPVQECAYHNGYTISTVSMV